MIGSCIKCDVRLWQFFRHNLTPPLLVPQIRHTFLRVRSVSRIVSYL